MIRMTLWSYTTLTDSAFTYPCRAFQRKYFSKAILAHMTHVSSRPRAAHEATTETPRPAAHRR
jgi:hypothetical protein